MVEIIPKPANRPAIWLNILFYFSILAVIAALLSLFILMGIERSANKELVSLKSSLSQKRMSLESLEKQVFVYQRKLQDFSLLFEKHQTPAGVFAALDKFAHPKVQFTELNLNAVPSGWTVGISGQSESFSALHQQIDVFQKSTEINQVKLSKIAIAKQGGAIFGLSLSLVK